MHEYWRTHGPSLGQIVDADGETIRGAGNNWGGAVLDALRSADDAGEGLGRSLPNPAAAGASDLYRVGDAAELLDALSEAVTVHDAGVKRGGEPALRTAAVAGLKWVVGNKAGGTAATAVAGSAGSVLPAVQVAAGPEGRTDCGGSLSPVRCQPRWVRVVRDIDAWRLHRNRDAR
jgi:hypothetical protein